MQPIKKTNSPATHIITGPVFSTVRQMLSADVTYALSVIHKADSFASSLFLEIWPALIFKTDTILMAQLNFPINDSNFYTDVNGMYLLKRRLKFAIIWVI